MATRAEPRCPVSSSGGDERKTVGVSGRGGMVRNPVAVTGFAEARTVLRSPDAEQAGFLSDLARRYSRMKQPILFLSGEDHRRQRKATARFFAPKVVAGRYRDLIRSETDRLIGGFRAQGSADLDTLSLDLAVTVAGEIVGLTNSDAVAMAHRLETITGGGDAPRWPLAKLAMMLRRQWQVRHFLRNDVRPAIAARKAEPGEDVISHLISEGYNEQEILVECLTYGAAGMITTREFITMAGWHMLQDTALRTRFTDADDEGKIALLEEILRLEPVVGTIYRRVPGQSGVLGIDIRATNTDESVVGGCPFSVDADRQVAPKYGNAVMAFGDGEHRCPGAQVAMHEAAIFLEALMQVPGLRLVREPTVGWNALITGYELRGATLSCDKTAA